MTTNRKLEIAELALELEENWKDISVGIDFGIECLISIQKFYEFAPAHTVCFTTDDAMLKYSDAYLEYRLDTDFSKCEEYIKELDSREKPTEVPYDEYHWLED